MRYLKRLPLYFALAASIIFVFGILTIVSAVNIYAYKTRALSRDKIAELHEKEAEWEIKRAVFHQKPKKFDVDIDYSGGGKL